MGRRVDGRTQGFFDRPTTHDLLRQLDTENCLTIFCGAGVNADAGLPGFGALVASLLASERPSYPAEEALLSWKSVVESFGVQESASAAVQLINQNQDSTSYLNAVVENILNKQTGGIGGLTLKIAELAVARANCGLPTVLVTTNYDNRLQKSAVAVSKELDDPLRIVGIGGRQAKSKLERALKQRCLPIVYLHGGFDVGGKRVDVALSEVDISASRRNWQFALLRHLVKSSHFLFVGSSVRDVDVVHAFSEAEYRQPAVALFCREDPVFGADETTRALTERLCEARLAHFGIAMHLTDYFGQIPQIFNELWICVNESSSLSVYDRSANSKQRYDRRLRLWWSSLVDSVERSTSAPKDRVRFQQRLHSSGTIVANHLGLSSPRDWKMELWIRRNPEQRQLSLWSTSESVAMTTDTLHQAHIADQPAYVSVKAFRTGWPTSGVVDNRHSRWRWYISAPVRLENAPWLGLPVGVVTFLCRQEPPRTDIDSKADAIIAMREVGEALLRA